MPWMTEYTLLTTLAFHHLAIGALLSTVMLVASRFIITSVELKSWLWMTVFVVSTLIPFTLITLDTNLVALNAVGLSDNVSNQVANDTTNDTTNEQVKNLLYQEPAGTHWHLPSSLVFDFSLLLSLALVVWVLGSLWRIYVTVQMWFRTKSLIADMGTKSLLHSTYIGMPVYICPRVSSPMVVGYISPTILLPSSIVEQLNPLQIDAILQHEKAHVTRKDNWFALFQELIAIAFWWSPVIRLLNRHIHIQREIACDLRAANTLNNAKQYAQSLIDCASLMVHQHRSILAMGLFSKKKELVDRIHIVLKNKTARKLHSAVIALICLCLGVSTIQAAQMFAPKISIDQTKLDARQYSLLPIDEGSALIDAVMRNDIAAIQSLQDEGVDINTPAIGDGTALMIAVKTKNRLMVEALIALGADVNQSSIGDGNPLIVAAIRNDIELAQLLLNKGAKVNALVKNDETALINASYYGHLEMTQMLVNNGADVNLSVTTGASDGYEVRTPLSRAGNSNIEDFLIANGAVE